MRNLIVTVLIFICINQIFTHDGFLMLKGTSFKSNNIQDTLVGDLISHVSGSYPLNKYAPRENFPTIDLFAQNSNLFIAIEGLGEANLNKIKNPTFFNEQSIELQTPFYPQDSLSTLTSIVTGTDYSNHGIVGHSWNSVLGEVKAYSPSGDCQVAKISDLISEARDINIVSVSGDFQLAAAVAPHNELNKPGNFAYYVSELGLQNLYTDEIIASKKEIKTSVADLANDFNLKSPEDFKFASEIYVIRNMLTFTPTDKNAFVSIAIGSIKGLTVKYGIQSPKVKNALQILDRELATLYENMNAQFSGLTTEIVGLTSSIVDHTIKTQSVQLKKTLDDSTTETTYTLSDVQSFQTSIWTAFFLTIAMIVTLVFFCKMEGAENSIIYKTTDGPRPIPDVQ